DSGFEKPVLTQKPPANQVPNPPGTPWTFTPSSGIAGNGSNFTALNGPAPEGVQVAYLQNLGAVSQMVNLQAATYLLRFYPAQCQRAQGVDQQTIDVFGGASKVATIKPSGANYTAYSVPFTLPADGMPTIKFVGTVPPGVDTTAFIDAVSLTVKL